MEAIAPLLSNGEERSALRSHLADLLELTKPRLTALNLVAAEAAYWLAPGAHSWGQSLLLLVGTALIIGAANTFNCYLERELDGRMSRTKHRPLPAGRLSPRLALLYGVGMVAVGAPLAALASPLSCAFALLALLLYVALYTPMKRISDKALYVGALPGALPVLVGSTAAAGRVELTGALLFLLLFCWQLPHFLAISLYRAREYARGGFKVLANTRGQRAARLLLVRSQCAVVVISLGAAAIGDVRWLYLVVASLAGAAMLLRARRGLSPAAESGWARSFFLSTNLYLVALMSALLVDHYL